MRPNILLLNSHDTGQYLQPYGYAFETPQLQKLAEQGVLFRSCFSAAPTCSPSRAALLTGQSAHSSGMLGLAHRGFKLHDVSQHLAHWLKHQQGYHTALAGLQHVVPQDALASLDYDRVMLDRQQSASQAAHFLDTYRGDKPFYLEVGFFDTHRYAATDEHLGPFSADGPRGDPRYIKPPAPLPDHPDIRQDMADYGVCVARLDRDIGRVLKALDDNNLADNTLVIYSTDHGIAFPNMKCSLTDHGIRVALIMRGPQEFHGGKVVDALISQLDLFPTLCDVLNVAAPPHLQGSSLLPLLREEKSSVRDAIFAEVNFHAAYEPKRAVRSERYKYIKRFDKRISPVLPNTDDSPSKTVWLEHDWAGRAIAPEQLYDLIFDPHETHNLVDDSEYQVTLEALRAKLETWMLATADPLLEGELQAPEGAILNPVEGLSPNEASFVVSKANHKRE